MGRETFEEDEKEWKNTRITGYLMESKERVTFDDFIIIKVMHKDSLGKVLQGIHLIFHTQPIKQIPRMFAPKSPKKRGDAVENIRS